MIVWKYLYKRRKQKHDDYKRHKKEKNDYKLQMVLNNHIEGLVQISVESINNETMLYYDISSKTQMSNMFTRKQMSGKELYIFIKDIKMLSERMSEYLLTLDN